MKQKLNIIDRIFGRLKIISAAEPDGSHRRWLCKCECGNEKIIYETALCRGMTKSCGCYNRDIARIRASKGWGNILTRDFLIENHVVQKKSLREISRNVGCSLSCVIDYIEKFSIKINDVFYDIIGKKYGRLTVESLSHTQNSMSYWNVKCDCGVKKVIQGKSIISNQVVSCGCWNLEKCWKGYGDLSYSYWARLMRGAIQRNIEFTVNIEYAWNLFLKQERKCALSGQNITIEKQYKKGLENHNNKQTASIDRIDSSLGYTEENIQWVHVKINRMKSNFKQDEFIEFCKQIAEYKK